jgi:hypothetical protein
MRVRLAVGLMLMVGASMFSGAKLANPEQMALRMIGVEPAGSKHLLPYFDRVRALKGALPLNGHVGFATDEPDYLVYLLAQQALVPLFLDHVTTREYVVGVFGDAHKRDELMQQGLRIIQETGDGVVLLKTTPQ